MSKVLKKDFFDRSGVEVARELIGCFLVRRINGQIHRFLISETEAYEGPQDMASHASRGKTKRTVVMFGKPAVLYVYFVYGMHWMLNVVTGPEGYPAAVLIRGIENIQGPARLTKALKITGEFTGKLSEKNTGLWFEKGVKVLPRYIKRTPRIGVAYAGPVWSKKLYRFVYKQK